MQITYVNGLTGGLELVVSY